MIIYCRFVGYMWWSMYLIGVCNILLHSLVTHPVFFFFSRHFRNELRHWSHCSPHKHKNRILPSSSARFSWQESGLGAFVWTAETIQICLIGLQHLTICSIHIAMPCLLTWVLKVTVLYPLYNHGLQYLLFSVSCLLTCVFLKTRVQKFTKHSTTRGCGVHICLWLLKRFTLRQTFNAKHCHYWAYLIYQAACLNSLQPSGNLLFAFLSVSLWF